MGAKRELIEFFLRLFFAALTFVGSLLLAAVFVGASAALEWLIGLTLDEGTLLLAIFKWVSALSLLGVALVITSCGAIVVCMETIASTTAFVRSLRN